MSNMLDISWNLLNTTLICERDHEVVSALFSVLVRT
jgi:hypothetical protein